MKEIISVFVGQGGVQLSSAVWELFAAEHSISIDGQIFDDDTFNNFKGIDRFFYLNSQDQALPRCILIDLDPTVIDEIRNGSYKEFFAPTNLITGTEDSASIFSRGYFTQGRLFLNDIIHHFNQQVEMTDCMQGFTFMHALGGGTGSGLCSLILEELDGYSKVAKIDLSIHPSFPSSPIIVEPYNSVLSEHYTIDETDISFMVDNEALFRIANTNLQIAQPSYANVNRIIAQAFSSITSASRFGDLSSTLSEVLHNLVPYPRIHFPTCSIAPLNNNENQTHSVNSIYSITQEALTNKLQLLNCFPSEGKYMTCCLMYRGNAHSGEIYEAIRKLKCRDNLRFVDWCPTGIKVTLCSRGPTYISKSGIGSSDKMITIVSNNSSITDPMLHNTFRFQVLFQKRAFVHWYVGEGMEEDEFKDSLENIACLIKDYDECALSTKLLEDNPDIEIKINENNVKESTPNVQIDIEKNTMNVIKQDDLPKSPQEKLIKVEEAEPTSVTYEETNAANENNYVEEDWVSSIQPSESYESYNNFKKDLETNNSGFSNKMDQNNNFSTSVTLPVMNKSF